MLGVYKQKVTESENSFLFSSVSDKLMSISWVSMECLEILKLWDCTSSENILAS